MGAEIVAGDETDGTVEEELAALDLLLGGLAVGLNGLACVLRENVTVGTVGGDDVDKGAGHVKSGEDDVEEGIWRTIGGVFTSCMRGVKGLGGWSAEVGTSSSTSSSSES